MFETTPSPALQRLLDASLAYPPEYAAGLSSHLPMALAALEGLGADEARLQAFFAAYTRRFKDRQPAATAAPLAGWQALRGDIANFPRLQAGFAAALDRQGRDAVLRESLPLLIDGVAAAAFHGPIRTAHAVESQHNGELAAALAYWAARWQVLPPPQSDGPPVARVADWLDAIDLQLRQQGGRGASGALISERMREAADSPTYRSWAGRWQPGGRAPGAVLHELALAAAARYAATRNFTVLHIATGARAARILAPWLPAGEATLAPLWHAVAAASMASGAAFAAPHAAAVAGNPDWPALRARACASDDDHVIKLVHAMATQNAAAPHAVWLQAAAAALAGDA